MCIVHQITQLPFRNNTVTIDNKTWSSSHVAKTNFEGSGRTKPHLISRRRGELEYFLTKRMTIPEKQCLLHRVIA